MKRSEEYKNGVVDALREIQRGIEFFCRRLGRNDAWTYGEIGQMIEKAERGEWPLPERALWK